MTTAHRPTFDPARGKEAPKGPAYHQRLLPAHTKLKVRQPGQGGDADGEVRDLRAELLKAEAAHFAKKGKGISLPEETRAESPEGLEGSGQKRAIEDSGESDGAGGEPEEENLEAKRRRILEETRDIDADSDGGSDNDSSEEDSDDEDNEDETAELLRELEKIKRERAEQREREERERAAEEQEKKEFDVARGNPLLNPSATDFRLKRRWDDDVIFKNQARGADDKNKRKEFVNDLLRSDFHKRFMNKYVR
ncbi:Cwf15/Cwc15 cell cycle control protein [Tuber magnatum]|uniref:Cwf15/Cwc15 cell cycle control protein n=1 Tax=Tuber magnatum TaxID=42249 RepID=A0A317SYK0_9PEZI|nr:Cwf15/Cwc15 cell cycle control protein [Tuber magnatum]